jgi:uncharacterized membrane protein YfcA
MAFVDMMAAFFMGALSGMGIGGGGLLVIYLTLIRGAEQINAQGINLYFFVFASIAALFIHCRKRRIDYSLVLLLSAFGMPVSLFGGLLASVTDPYLLRKIFGVMLIIAGGISLVRTVLPYIINKKERKK